MTSKTTPSEAFRNEEQDKEEREKILEEDIFDCEEDKVHYYGSQEEEEDEEAKEEEDEAEEKNLEQRHFSTDVENDHMSKFFKLSKALQATRKMRRSEVLVDYSQSQLLASYQHLSNLEEMAARNERVQSEKVQKLKERELKKAKKAEERELKEIQRAKAEEAKHIARDLKRV